MRLRAFPFDNKVDRFLAAHDQIYVVEQNRDAQLRSLLLLESNADKDKLLPLLFYDGLPVTAHDIVEAISQDQAKGVAA